MYIRLSAENTKKLLDFGPSILSKEDPTLSPSPNGITGSRDPKNKPVHSSHETLFYRNFTGHRAEN
jgi:hypothetical protein